MLHSVIFPTVLRECLAKCVNLLGRLNSNFSLYVFNETWKQRSAQGLDYADLDSTMEGSSTLLGNFNVFLLESKRGPPTV